MSSFPRARPRVIADNRAGPARGAWRRWCACARVVACACAVAGVAVRAGAQQQPPRPAASDSGRLTTAVAPTDSIARPSGSVRVCAGGDVSLGTNLDTTWTRLATQRVGRRVAAMPAPDSLLAPLRPLFAGADLVLLNVEAAIGSGPTRTKCGPRSVACYALRMPERAAGAFRRVAPDSAVVVGNVANNHARDAGLAGFAVTQRHLVDAGVLVTGADTLPTFAVTARGDTVALLGFSTSGVPDARDLGAVRRHVARAAARSSRVIVTMHLGAEGVRAAAVRDTSERYYDVDRGNPIAFARAAVTAGADLVVGHGPHLLRAAEWRDGALVAYSLGNLITYGSFSFAAPLDRAGVLCATLDADGRPADAVLHSTRQRLPGLVAVDSTARGAILLDSLSRADFPSTGVRVGRDGAIGSWWGTGAGEPPARDSLRAGLRRQKRPAPPAR